MDVNPTLKAETTLKSPRTKVVCTLGPASSNEVILRDMIAAGMTVARINLSHGAYETHESNIRLVRQLAADLGKVVAVLGDLQGPKIRIGKIEPEPLVLDKGMEVALSSKPLGGNVSGARPIIPFSYPEVIRGAQIGGMVWLDDGLIEMRIIDKAADALICLVEVGGNLTSRKGITAPGVSVNIPSITPKDREDLAFAIDQGVDFVAMSFVRTANDVLDLRELIRQRGSVIPIVAKIERSEALENLEEIINHCDAAMVARGDLGVEAVFEEVPAHQMRIIHVCNLAAKPVITATQMLHSMNEASHPTRAEANDVFTSIHQGSDAVMLSSETAVGAHPVRAVEAMCKIARMAEQHYPYKSGHLNGSSESNLGITEGVGLASCELAGALGVKAIITNTMSGRTTREVVKHRPVARIISTTPSKRTHAQSALIWGVDSLLVPEFQNTDEMIDGVLVAARDEGLLKSGDLVVLTAGTPVGEAGQTNLIQALTIP